MTPINPGILKTVQFLNANGFKTTDSGDGETHDFECDMPFPYVHIEVNPYELISESQRLFWLLAAEGVAVGECNEENTAPTVEASYNPAWGDKAYITVSNVKL